MKRPTSWLIQDQFYPGAKALRKSFDERFGNPREGHPDRFVWDYWHVPDQYTLLRTPAARFFTPKEFNSLHSAILDFGRTQLGCSGITPTWVSAYVDGCGQEFHADLPHGPWAFVYSLSPPGRPAFEGGETLLLRPEILDFWSRPKASSRGKQAREFEQDSVLKKIPARFNRLVVFDPRIPHGVSRVRGTRDLRDARLVVHGWFNQPSPNIESAPGGLTPQKATPILDGFLQSLTPAFETYRDLEGALVLRLDVRPDGALARITIQADTLVSREGGRAARQRVLLFKETIGLALEELRFPKTRAKSRIILPFYL
jgi:hypothetical protein